HLDLLMKRGRIAAPSWHYRRYDLRRYRRRQITIDEGFGAVDRQSDPLFRQQGQQVFGEVIILEPDLDTRIPQVKDFGPHLEGPGQKLALCDGRGLDHRQTPKAGWRIALRLADDVTTHLILGQLDHRPI